MDYCTLDEVIVQIKHFLIYRVKISTLKTLSDRATVVLFGLGENRKLTFPLIKKKFTEPYESRLWKVDRTN